MSDSEKQPAWDKLPHDPQSFFELTEGFTLENLKTSYSKLVRRFKPDKFPGEFKRIRAAYEELERSLRYGRSDGTRTQPSNESPSAESSEQSDSNREYVVLNSVRFSDDAANRAIPWNQVRNPLSETDERMAAIREIETKDPAEWYASLQGKPRKTAFDYQLLAMLSDVVEDKQCSYATWILNGLEEYPSHANLLALLRGLMRDALFSVEEARVFLTRIASSPYLRDFYYLTEPLWFRLLPQTEWEDFESLLNDCELRLRNASVYQKVAFYVGLIRKAMYRAPLIWLSEMYLWIGRQADSLYGMLEYEHERNGYVIDLRKNSPAELQNGPYGKKILGAIRAYCEEDEWTGICEIVHCQLEIAENPNAFLKEFPADAREHADWVQGWLWISWSTLSELASAGDERKSFWSQEMLLETISEVDESFGFWMIRKLEALQALVIVLYFVAVLFIDGIVIVTSTVMMGSFITKNDPWVAATALLELIPLVGIPIFFYFRLRRWWQANVFQPAIARRILFLYSTRWRMLFAKIFSTLHCRHTDVVQFCEQCGEKLRFRTGAATWLPRLLRDDQGLMLYSIAVLFVR